MTDALVRRSRSVLASSLCSALILVSPGFSSYEAVAGEFQGPAGKPVINALPEVNANLGRAVVLPGAEALPNIAIPGAQIPGAVIPDASLILPSPSAGLIVPQQNELAAPGTPQSEAQALGKLGETLQPQIEAAGSADNVDPRSSGERIEQLIEGRTHSDEAQAAVASSARTGSDVLPAAELPNPFGLYQHAYPLAVAKAQELGKTPAQVHFYEAAASVPGVDGASWKFSFYLTDKETTPDQLSKDKPKIGDIIYVDFNKTGFGSRGHFTVSDDPALDGYLQRYTAGQTKFAAPHSFAQTYDIPTVTIYKNAPLASDWVPFTAEPTYFRMGSQSSAQGALESGRRQGLSGGVSVSFKMREEPVSGDADYWYHFYDVKGNEFLANGRSTEDRWLKKAETKPVETASQRLDRFTNNGKGAGIVAGLIAAAGIYHGVSHIDLGSQYALGAYFVGMLFSPLMMALSALGLTSLGGKLGAWLSGIKTPKIAAAPTAPKIIETAKPLVEAPKAVAAVKYEPISREKEGRAAGELIGVALTLVGTLTAAQFSGALTAAAGLGGILIAVAFPFVGLALVLGGAAVGASIGRRIDANGGKLNLGVVANGVLAGVGTLLASGLIGAATGWAWPMVVASLAAVEAAAGFIGLIAAAVKNGGRIDFKNDPLARASSVFAISGVLAGATFAAVASWLTFTVAGTIKDKAGAKVLPFEQGAGAVYKEAYAAALAAATAKGYKPSQVMFAGIIALAPKDATRGWTAQFIARKDAKSERGELFEVQLYPQKDGGLKASQAYSYGDFSVNGVGLGTLNSGLAQKTRAPLELAIKNAAKALRTPESELGLSMEFVDKDLWYIFDNETGRRFGYNARTGEGRDFEASTLTLERIEAAAKSVGSYKGRPWSHTEYNMQESLTGDSLRRVGATPAQLRLFYKLCDAQPMRPGGFNPWAGD